MCKEDAALEIGQKMKVTFNNNRTFGTNSKLYFRGIWGKLFVIVIYVYWEYHRGMILNKLNHMWAAIEVTNVT